LERKHVEKIIDVNVSSKRVTGMTNFNSKEIIICLTDVYMKQRYMCYDRKMKIMGRV